MEAQASVSTPSESTPDESTPSESTPSESTPSESTQQTEETRTEQNPQSDDAPEAVAESEAKPNKNNMASSSIPVESKDVSLHI